MGRECNDIEEFGPIRVAKVKIHTIDDVGVVPSAFQLIQRVILC